MAVTNYSKRCTSCGGNKWEYLKNLKIWECRYCGSQVERQEQYDGLYTIKNVVRQVVLDSAYRRLDQADRNISECQKISARYVGTLIAGICFRLIAAVNGGYGGQDPRSMLGQLRRDYQTLTEESPELSDDETALYEFMDSSDAWAALATVFDTLGDQKRREYLLTLTDPAQVYSKETNKSLLRFALKNDRQQLVEQILANKEYLDVPDAFRTVLEHCPDGEMKGRLAADLLDAGALKAGEESMLEDYLAGSDSVATKAAIAVAACNRKLVLSLDVLMREVMAGADLPMLQQLLAALSSRRLYDGEVAHLLDFAAAQTEAGKCLAILDALTGPDQFVALTNYQAQAFMCNSNCTVEDRCQILQRLRKFAGNDRMWETVTGNYLCQCREETAVRGEMMDMLLQGMNAVPARDFEQYVLQNTLDGEQKPQMIAKLLELPGMNPGFFRELAGKYLKNGADPDEQKQAVLHQLLDSGLAIDAVVLVDYVCVSEDSDDSKVELIQLAVKNGTALRSDALSTYLERCPDRFSPQVFALLFKDASSVTTKALENYVLRCADAPAVKANNALTLASRMGISLGASACTVRFQGCQLSCSLAQAYLLTTGDDIALAGRMIGAMTGSGTKLNTDVKVDGRNLRFNKFLNEKKNSLSPVALQLCQENRLFSFSLF